MAKKEIRDLTTLNSDKMVKKAQEIEKNKKENKKESK